jgi:histidinol dehydrogenase
MKIIIENPAKTEWKSLLTRPTMQFEEIEKRVAPILQKVKLEGDKALFQFALDFDKVQLNTLAVTAQEISAAQCLVSEDLKTALNVAKANIVKFHEAQVSISTPIETVAGVTCWRKAVGIQKVGLYIPGGTAPLFSTVLMLGVPAQIAGCEEVVLCTPPDKEGNVHPAILYAASLVGITKIFKVGGAQAIAALAYGTESIPQVYKIFGPGNQYVTAAKTLVNKEGIAIDMPAGPSEVQVIADETAIPAFVAADLLSQAEHGADSQVLLVASNKEVATLVMEAVKIQLEALPRKELAAKALENSKVIVLSDMAAIIALTNEYAPEHLIIATENAEELADKITNAGSVFIGNYTPESAGDYASGTNHTLPTNGFAKAYSGVSLDSFVKKITFQKISPEGLQNIGPTVQLMAENELLFAHKNAVTVRLDTLN